MRATLAERIMEVEGELRLQKQSDWLSQIHSVNMLSVRLSIILSQQNVRTDEAVPNIK